MSGWNPGILPQSSKYGAPHFIRFAVRWTLLAIVIYGLFALFLLVRLVEWPWGRPVTPSITRLACLGSLSIIGLKLRVLGNPMAGPGAVVANHVTWIDIFSFNAVQRIIFVAKTEVAEWTGIGILAKATGTVFVERNPRRALRQRDEFVTRLARGDKLLFFPEGTSTDGLRVLPFKPTLFAAFFAEELKDRLKVQPVTVRYRPRKDQDPAFYGFWGEMGFGESMLKVLSAPRNGDVDVIFHEPVRVAGFAHRKDLAAYCEGKVREGLQQRIDLPQLNPRASQRRVFPPASWRNHSGRPQTSKPASLFARRFPGAEQIASRPSSRICQVSSAHAGKGS